MSILISDEIKKCIYKELQSCHQSIIVITAFCKQKGLEFVEKNCDGKLCNKKLIVRFQLEDIVNGATDLQLYDYCREHGWKMYVHFNLHAKLYVFDNKNGVIGSSNLTNRGILLEDDGNLEMAEKCELDETDIQKINCLINNSIEMNEQIYNIMKNELAEKAGNSNASKITWSERITRLFHPKETMLFISDFPEYDTVKESMGRNITFLEITNEDKVGKIKEAFVLCRAYKWLLELLRIHDGEMYFGEITAKLHNVLVNDPKPYRKDIKVLLARLLGWIQELECEEIVVDRPGHSQRVRLR